MITCMSLLLVVLKRSSRGREVHVDVMIIHFMMTVSKYTLQYKAVDDDDDDCDDNDDDDYDRRRLCCCN